MFIDCLTIKETKIMKKTYIEPAMIIVNVKIGNIMETISYGGKVNSVQGDARRSNVWDDDEE